MWETYLSGIELLATKGVVVGTHDGRISCNTVAVVVGMASIVGGSFGVMVLASRGYGASCDFGETISPGKRKGRADFLACEGKGARRGLGS